MKARLIVGGELRADGETSDGERRIVESIARVLQVRELAVLLGSGASMHLGSPSIRHMTLDAMEALLEQHANESLARVEPALATVVGDDEVDFEDLLATVSTALAFAARANASSVPMHGREVSVDVLAELLAALNRALALACDLPCLPEDAPLLDPWRPHREFLRRLLQSRRGDLSRPWIFTTNYDLVLERTLDDAGIPYFDGFVGTVDRTMQLETYQYDLYLPPAGGDRRLLRVPNMLRLAKLHGSINWRSVPSPSGRGTRRVVQRMGAVETGDLAVIYPTPQKETDVVGHPYADLLRLFGAALTASETAVLCIGYGFADEHINRLIYQALPSNPTLQLVIVDPFGVHEEGAFCEGPVASLAQIPDQRIAVLTGEDTKFDLMPFACMPDPERIIPDRSEIVDALSDALLRGNAEAEETETAP